MSLRPNPQDGFTPQDAADYEAEFAERQIELEAHEAACADMDEEFGDEEWGVDDFEFDGQPDEAQEWHDFDPDC